MISFSRPPSQPKAEYLVTGDKKLQDLRTYEGVTIVSPREFLDTLATFL